MKKRTTSFILFLTISSFAFSQDNTFIQQATDWYFANIILADLNISNNQFYDQGRLWKTNTCVIGECAFNNKESKKGKNYSIGYLQKRDKNDGKTTYRLKNFNYYNAWHEDKNIFGSQIIDLSFLGEFIH